MTKQKLAAFDIDGTLFRSGLHREVCYELIKMEKVPESVGSELTAKHREWRHRLHGNAFEEFERTVVAHFDALTTQIKVADYDEAVKRVLPRRRFYEDVAAHSAFPSQRWWLDETDPYAAIDTAAAAE